MRFAVLAAGVVTTLAACSSSYVDRRDPISPTLGNAVRSNIALHTDDFWSRQAFDPNIPMRGARAVNVVRSYDTAANTASGGGGSGGGNCANPGDTAADGSQCGGRAASVRPGGR